jgi:dolichol-phosphate mannosyltransferase
MKTLVAIPVHNERRHVTQVLDEVRKYAGDILVVDDGSTDDTPLLLAHQPVEVIRHARNRGYGQALIDAFRYAQCQCCCYDWLITMDCDEQHEPASLPVFLDLAARGGADVVSGSRYMGPADQGGAAGAPPADRREINRVITQQVNGRLGLKLTDAFCGFKAFRVAALRRLELNEPGYAFPLQFWVQAAARGLRIVETPVRLIYNDPNRSFGAHLDNPDLRLRHYLEVFERELAKFPDKFPVPVQVS